MKEHEHTYIPAQFAEECLVCGLLKSTIESMNKTKDQVVDKSVNQLIAAFPSTALGVTYDGMTLLDYFAGKALQGLIAQGGIQSHLDGLGENSDPKINAKWAYKYAKAMLKERECL